MRVADDRLVGTNQWKAAYGNDPTWAHVGPGARVSMRYGAGWWVMCVALMAAGCGGGNDDANAARGRGLHEASLPVEERATIYESAVRAAFDKEPSLSLLLYPELLPRGSGYGSGPAVAPQVVRSLRNAEVVQGTCGPFAEQDAKRAPRCQARIAGYVVRFSPVLSLGRDSVEVYLSAQRYDLPGAAPHQRFAFERAYQLVKRNGKWQVVREGRVA